MIKITVSIVMSWALAAIASSHVNVRLSDTPSVIRMRKLGAAERSPFDSVNMKSRATLQYVMSLTDNKNEYRAT